MCKERKIITWCAYCHNPIYEGESMICVNGNYYHYDENNLLNNCYYPENREDDEE